MENSTCLTTCSSFKYADSISKICQPCDAACLTCNGGATNNCLSCTNNNYLFGSTCVSVCPNGYYPASDFICKACHSSCQLCNNPLATDCTACSTGKFLKDHTCLTTCPTGYFGDTVLRICSLCNSECLTCSGANNN